MTLSVLCVTLLLISLDNTVLNVALPTIVRRLVDGRRLRRGLRRVALVARRIG
jgi:hypothetical protein